jgi:hypothetical protein
MTILPSNFTFNELPSNTIIPPLEEEAVFIQYLNRLYEDIAFAVNNKDNIFYTIPITSGVVNIPNMTNFGAFIVCVSGVSTGMPAYTWALTKASNNAMGTVAILTSQVGTIAPWVGATLTITSTAKNYQIRHSVANTIGNFNIRFISTF